MELQRAAKFGNDRGAAQQVGGERTAARPELGKDHAIGAAEALPHQRAPQPDQLAENLADLGGGNEIPAAADRLPGRVIAELGVVERHRHVGRHRKRPLGADTLGDLVGKRAGGHGADRRGVRRAQKMIRRPAIKTGIDKSWPIVVPKIR